jgi:hypothetical protein
MVKLPVIKREVFQASQIAGSWLEDFDLEQSMLKILTLNMTSQI